MRSLLGSDVASEPPGTGQCGEPKGKKKHNDSWCCYVLFHSFFSKIFQNVLNF